MTNNDKAKRLIGKLNYYQFALKVKAKAEEVVPISSSLAMVQRLLSIENIYTTASKLFSLAVQGSGALTLKMRYINLRNE